MRWRDGLKSWFGERGGGLCGEGEGEGEDEGDDGAGGRSSRADEKEEDVEEEEEVVVVVVGGSGCIMSILDFAIAFAIRSSIIRPNTADPWRFSIKSSSMFRFFSVLGCLVQAERNQNGHVFFLFDSAAKTKTKAINPQIAHLKKEKRNPTLFIYLGYLWWW